jgi:plasmid stabilization system protein ParE
MYRSLILPPAKEDIRDAARWYNKQSQGLGKRFIAEVRDSVQFIKQNPTASSIRYDEVRTTVLKVFPFMIHYTIDEDNKTVVISAVLHTSRDPEVWKKR